MLASRIDSSTHIQRPFAHALAALLVLSTSVDAQQVDVSPVSADPVADTSSPAPPAPAPPLASPWPVASAPVVRAEPLELRCEPDCRVGFDCQAGRCVSTRKRIHLEGDCDTVELEARHPLAGWDRVCTLPCSLEVDPGRPYRVTGEGVRARRVRLDPWAADSTVRVNAGSAWKRPVGWTLAATGAVSAAIGMLGFLLSSAPLGPHGGGSDRDVPPAAYWLTGGGLVAMGVGVGVAFSGETTFDVVEPRAATRAASGPVAPHARAATPATAPPPAVRPNPSSATDAPPPIAQAPRIAVLDSTSGDVDVDGDGCDGRCGRGLACVLGQCVRGCNPQCPSSMVCTAELTCETPEVHAKLLALEERDARTGHRHDGFYLSFGAGPGAVWPVRRDAPVPVGAIEFAIGGTPLPGLVLAFTEQFLVADGRVVALGGAMVDYYPAVSGPWHVSSSVGALIANGPGRSRGPQGVGLSVALGYQPWLSRQWSGGPLVRATYGGGADLFAAAVSWEFVLH